MSKNNSFRFPTTALINPQPRPTEKKHVGLMLIDEQTCAVCGGPVADIHDKYCSKRCVRIKNAKVQQKSIDAKKYRAKHKEKILAQKKQYYEANKEIILAKLKAKRAKA